MEKHLDWLFLYWVDLFLHYYTWHVPVVLDHVFLIDFVTGTAVMLNALVHPVSYTAIIIFGVLKQKCKRMTNKDVITEWNINLVFNFFLEFKNCVIHFHSERGQRCYWSLHLLLVCLVGRSYACLQEISAKQTFYNHVMWPYSRLTVSWNHDVFLRWHGYMPYLGETFDVTRCWWNRKNNNI